MPDEEEGDDTERTSPSSFVVLRSRDVVAFLDILPMVGGKFFHVEFGFSVIFLSGWELFVLKRRRNPAKDLFSTISLLTHDRADDYGKQATS